MIDEPRVAVLNDGPPDVEGQRVVQLRTGLGLVVFAREVRFDYPEPGLVTIYPTSRGVVSVTVNRDEILAAPS